MQQDHAFSERRASGLMTIEVSSYRYETRRKDEPLRTKLVELAREKRAEQLPGSKLKNLLLVLGAETLPEIVRDNSGEYTRVRVDRSSEGDFPKKLLALNSKRSD